VTMVPWFDAFEARAKAAWRQQEKHHKSAVATRRPAGTAGFSRFASVAFRNSSRMSRLACSQYRLISAGCLARFLITFALLHSRV